VIDVFISWSGPTSGAAAEALRGWLPKIINAIQPCLSSADLDKGARWGSDVAVRLEKAKAGIIGLTPNNLHSDWILFEAGALSKTIQNTFVCPLLFGLEPTDVKGPLAQFQATRASKEDILKLLKTLNGALGDEALGDSHIEEAFEVWWPKLDSQLKKLPSDSGSSAPPRTERDLLEEILGFVRNQNRSSGSWLAEEDTKQVIQGRTWKAARSIYGNVGGSFAFTGVGSNFEVSLQLSGPGARQGVTPGVPRKYKIVIPRDASPDEMERIAVSQTKRCRRYACARLAGE
jgi:hypothetical protein